MYCLLPSVCLAVCLRLCIGFFSLFLSLSVCIYVLHSIFKGAGRGWWGQFTTRTGGFHAHNAAQFRRTGTFPQRTVACRAEISAIIAWVQERFPEAVAFNARLAERNG